jgi:hypothetical protein
LAAVPPPPAGPFVAPPPAAPVSNVGTMNQLLNGLFAGPNPPSPELLAILVSVLSPPPPSDPPPPPTPPIPVSNPPPTPPTPPQPPIITPPPPISLPPPVFNPTCQSQLTPSQC